MQTLFLRYNPSYMRKTNPEDIVDKRRNETVERFISRIRAEIYNLTPVDDYLEALRNDLYEYQKHNPECTEEDLESEFGTPEEIAKDFLEGNNAIQPKQIAKGKKTRNIIIVVLILALVALGGYLIDLHGQQQSMATDVIVIE